MQITGNKAYEQLSRSKDQLKVIQDQMEKIDAVNLPNLYPLVRETIQLIDERVCSSFEIVNAISLNESDLVFPTRSKFSGIFEKVVAAVAAGFDGAVDVVDAAAVSGYATISNSEGVMAGATAITDGTYNLKVTLNGELCEINTGALSTDDIGTALTELQVQLRAATTPANLATIAIDVDDKIRITGVNDGVTAGTVLIEDGDTDGFITALSAEAGITAVIDTPVAGTDATIKSETVTITADVAGTAGNDTITGDGISDVDTLVAALAEAYTVSAGGTEIPYDDQIIEITGGADATTADSTFVTVLADAVGDNDVVITGDGSDDLDTLAAAAGSYTVLGDGTQIPVLDEEINVDTGGAEIGDTIQLTATVLPADAADKTVTWASSDEAVATVDAAGLVTLVGVGGAQITATTNEGRLTASCVITIVA